MPSGWFMKHTDRLDDEELKLLDSINRMTSQLQYHQENKSVDDQASELEQTLEGLEDQLEAIRSSRETHNHQK